MLNLLGKKFSRLTVIEFNGKNQHGVPRWLCLCTCGSTTSALVGDLTTGHKKSCGCLQKERSRIANSTHNQSYTKLYKVWKSMKNRCLNKKEPNYKNYGGRGIKICPEWKHHFSIFRVWALINGYEKGLTIDRINNDGNYQPTNCQWLPNEENAKKTRRNINAFTRQGIQET